MGEGDLPLPFGERVGERGSKGEPRPGKRIPSPPLPSAAARLSPSPQRGEGEKVRHALAIAAARITSATPRLDAELLMAHALGVTREAVILRHLDDLTPAGFAELVGRRLAHEPVAYLTGTRAFWTIDLHVGPGALIPRADSETLLEAAVAHFGERSPGRILDLGTGPGTLLLAALDQWPGATGLGVDTSQRVIRIARDNVRRLGFRDRARILHGSWTGRGGPHDLILCNPPYIAENADLPREVHDWEPVEALFGGPDGLDCYRMIAPVLRPQLAAGGVACVEIGADQGLSAAALFAAEGLQVAVRQDLGGRDRCLVLTP